METASFSHTIITYIRGVMDLSLLEIFIGQSLQPAFQPPKHSQTNQPINTGMGRNGKIRSLYQPKLQSLLLTQLVRGKCSVSNLLEVLLLLFIGTIAREQLLQVCSDLNRTK